MVIGPDENLHDLYYASRMSPTLAIVISMMSCLLADIVKWAYLPVSQQLWDMRSQSQCSSCWRTMTVPDG